MIASASRETTATQERARQKKKRHQRNIQWGPKRKKERKGSHQIASSPQKTRQKQSHTPDITPHPESNDIESAQVGHFADSALSIIPWSYTCPKPHYVQAHKSVRPAAALCPEPTTITPENNHEPIATSQRNIENPKDMLADKSIK